nr:flavodoxin [uncultured Carboxylicivirga sp.]
MSQIGIFYGPQLGSVEKVANLIAERLGKDRVELIPVKNCEAEAINKFDNIILGASTIGKTNWDSEYKDTDWDVFATKLENAKWEGKKVAIYSLGDHIQYAEHFVDAIGWIYERLEKLNVEVVGFCPAEDYDFIESEGVRDGQFMGLPVDEDTEPEMTDLRVKNWVKRLINEFGF